jgi:hypothetical protein
MWLTESHDLLKRKPRWGSFAIRNKKYDVAERTLGVKPRRA